MKTRLLILSLFAAIGSWGLPPSGIQEINKLDIDFYGKKLQISFDPNSQIDLGTLPTDSEILEFCTALRASNTRELIRDLQETRKTLALDDWLFYQLIRKTAQQVSPKKDNYHRYTLYKWFLLSECGYQTSIKTSGHYILFYVQSDENIYNIPFYTRYGKQFVCLNYHDYGVVDFEKENFNEIIAPDNRNQTTFSYRITQLPEFNPADYREKELQFHYNDKNYHFRVKLNGEIKTIFANYPVVDYASYLNIPLSKETYRTLIPLLKDAVRGLNVKNGVDYLMHFTRYAFMYEKDSKLFGNEKRLSPEQTLLYDQSDCEDRVGLFFLLVKEIYDLPMIVLAYPEHVTIAVKFEKPVGRPIWYNGQSYSVCEPTPQKMDLPIGKLMPVLNHSSYEVVYAYQPGEKK